MKHLLFGLAIFFVVGCGGVPQNARHALAVTSSGVMAADAVIAPVYTRQAAACYDAHATAEGFLECRAGVDTAEQVLRTTHRSLLATQAGLDAWDAGDEGESFFSAAPCLTHSIGQLSQVMVEGGFDLPLPLVKGLSLMDAFGMECVP